MEIIEKKLPDDLNLLKKMISDLQHSLAEKEQQLTLQKTELALQSDKLSRHQQEVTFLRQKLQLALNERYGRSSEKLSGASTQLELNLFDEATLPSDANVAAIVQADEGITVAAHTRKKTGRRPLPSNLPREQIIHDLPQDQRICGCGQALHKMGEDIAEQLEFIPAQVKVIQHVRCKYACRRCEENGIKVAPLPPQPIPKSIASAGLLAHVLVSKYADHLPLYRQENILQRMKIDIARATLCHWVLRCADLFVPLVELLKKDICQGNYTQADETPVQVMKEPNRANTSKSYMWVYHGGQAEQRGIVYDYQPTRSGEAPKTFLSSFKGMLQTDGYGGYDALCRQNELLHAGCWAHARRKFMAIIKTAQPAEKAHEAVAFIRRLYKIEREAREQRLTAKQREALRQQHASPILIEFKPWLEASLNQVPPQSPIGQALAYTLNQWSLLTLYVNHGEI